MGKPIGIVFLGALAAAIFLALPRPEAAPQDRFIHIDGPFVTVSGTVAAVLEDQFTLDYGTGSATVLMQGYHPGGDSAEKLLTPGEKVVVGGVIEGDPRQMRKIRAGGIYVYNRDRHLHAGMAYDDMVGGVPAAPDIDWIAMTGRVHNLQPGEILIETDKGPVRVDIVRLTANPFTYNDLRRVDIGDEVRITGVPDNTFFDSRRVEAFSVVRLQ